MKFHINRNRCFLCKQAKFSVLNTCIGLFDWTRFDFYGGCTSGSPTATHCCLLNIFNLFSRLFTHYFQQRSALIDVVNIISQSLLLRRHTQAALAPPEERASESHSPRRGERESKYQILLLRKRRMLKSDLLQFKLLLSRIV